MAVAANPPPPPVLHQHPLLIFLGGEGEKRLFYQHGFAGCGDKTSDALPFGGDVYFATAFHV